MPGFAKQESDIDSYAIFGEIQISPDTRATLGAKLVKVYEAYRDSMDMNVPITTENIKKKLRRKADRPRMIC
jgi:hypothetical protein